MNLAPKEQILCGEETGAGSSPVLASGHRFSSSCLQCSQVLGRGQLWNETEASKKSPTLYTVRWDIPCFFCFVLFLSSLTVVLQKENFLFDFLQDKLDLNHVAPRLAMYLQSSCLNLPNAGITGIHQHSQLKKMISEVLVHQGRGPNMPGQDSHSAMLESSVLSYPMQHTHNSGLSHREMCAHLPH